MITKEAVVAKKKALIAVVLIVMVSAWGGYSYYDAKPVHKGPLKSQLPMVIFKDKTALYQVVTYDNEAITAMVVNLKPKYTQVFKNVYLNFRSQFVFGDGEPIIYKEEPIFWNKEGNVVNYNYSVINESNLFFIEEDVMPHGTPLTLLELKSIAKSNYYKALRDNVRMESLRLMKKE